MAVQRIYMDPLVSRKGKVIQVSVKNMDYLRIEPAIISGGGSVFHGNILENFLKESGIPFETADDSGPPHPKRMSSDGSYELVGAGSFEICSDGSYGFKGMSSTYDLEINRGNLERLLPFFPKGVSVKFGKYDATEVLGVGHGEL